MADPTSVRIYSGQVLAIVTHLKHVLEMNGVPCEVRGEYRGGAIGELPVTEAWPELWILDSTDQERAASLVAEALDPEQSTLPDWECPECNERIEPQFGECWNCGTKSIGVD